MRKLAALCLACCAGAYAAAAPEFHVPFEKYKLPNGLRVVLSRDTSVPVTAVYVIYDVGSRTEEKGRSGFAQLLARMSGGQVQGVQANGSAHLDYTEYFEAMPSNRLALALWLESGRMRSLPISEENLKARKDTLHQERQRNYDGQPYRSELGEKWPSLIFSDFHNVHSVMGLADDMTAATVDDVSKFFRTYYAPNNAVLVISGDFAVAETKKTVEQYFGDIPAQPPAPRPNVSEPARAEGKTLTVADEHARVPAVVIGWPAPKRHSPDWYALNMLDAVLTSGRGSKLEMELMRGRQSVVQVEANLGWPQASPLDYKEPAYYAAMLLHQPNFKPAEVVDEYQQVIDNIAATGIDETEFARVKAIVKLLKANGVQTALDRARLLGIAEAMDGDAGAVDRDYASLLAVTVAQLRAATAKYLTPARRDVMIIQPSPGAAK